MEEDTKAVKVSVILPMYNVENYIEQCMDSLNGQTLKEIEIICIDDGSTDNTLEILKEYEKKDNRIQIYHQKNQYAGVARNNGMKHAAGKYLLFLDADDFFDDFLLEKTYLEAERCDADVVLFGAQTYDETVDEVKPMPWSFNSKFLPKETPFSPADTKGNLYRAFTPAPWTKLFRKEFIEKKGLQFQPIQNSNDVFFTFTALGIAERISYVDESLVYYRRGMKTNLQSMKFKAPLCFLDAYWKAYCELKKQKAYEAVRESFNDAVISGCLYNYHSYEDMEIQEILLEAFESEKFQEMNLFYEENNDEEIIHGKQYYELKGLIKGHQWRKEQDRKCRPQIPELFSETKVDKVVKVSVIIPCYNKVNFLEECLYSIINQTLKEIEIICVNDGSDDGTLEILKDYTQKDSRIILASQQNAGLSIARNTGFNFATGEYVCFVDSDDMMDANALKELYEVACEKKLDILLFDGVSFFESETMYEEKQEYVDYYIRRNNYEEVYTGLDLMCKMFINKEYRQSACLQLIKRSYFLEKDLQFYPGILHEDNAFTFKAMLLSDRVSHVDKTYYRRRVAEDSIMTQKKVFSHAYGYFISYLCMCKTVEMVRLAKNQEAIIAKILDQMLDSARKIYRGLDEEEKYTYECLDSIEKSKFYNFVVFSKYDVDAERKKVAYYSRELQVLRKKLKKTKRNLSKIKKSRAYKIGNFILKPFYLIKEVFK